MSPSPIKRAPAARREAGAAGQAFAETASLAEAARDVQDCRRCDLYRHATQAVFGEGAPHAELMLVGEEPGDQEDLAGHPFVGPAGQVLDEALGEAGIDRQAIYVTNAVKHFKFEPRGKRRLHKRPTAGEVAACRFWLDLERAFIRPSVVVALGATAAASLLGRSTSVNALRGRPMELEGGETLFVTIHPSYLLRLLSMPDRGRADEERTRFVAELRQAARFRPERAARA